ncbi:hypothetical protein Dimus_039168 [Dionaea muscipula]
MKAYDTLDWDFLLDVMDTMGFPPVFRRWVRECITTPSYSASINGELCGFFRGGKGLRQGDSISPYLFIIAMEVLSGMFQHHIARSAFRFHWRCDRLRIVHLCFADDLLVFCRGDVESIDVVRATLSYFRDISGLAPSPAKSSVFFSGVQPVVRREILEILGFAEGTLPGRYLGVPLINTGLTYGDCRPLIDRILARVKSWMCRFLSYTGRAQLVRSVLFALQVYRASIFILQKRVLREIESIMRSFLWQGVELKPVGAKVAWDQVCLPRRGGGS